MKALLVVLALGVAGVAGASPASQPTQRVDFGADDVVGDRSGSDLMEIAHIKPRPGPSLIRLRTHFRVEVLQSVRAL